MSHSRAYFDLPTGRPVSAAGYLKVNRSTMSEISVLVDLSPEQKIYRHLKDNGQSIQWLADKLPISRSHLSRIINGEGNNKRTLAPEVRHQINQILKTDY
jgi:hypothetical protein